MKRMTYIVLALILLLCSCGQPSTIGEGENTAPTWQEQYDLGIRYLSEGNYEEAIIAFTAAIEVDPKRAEAYVGRGDAYVLSGETEEHLTAAQVDYEKAIELDETNVEAYLGLADVHIRQGNYDEALQVLKNALSKTKNNQSILDKIAEIESGNIVDSAGKIRRLSTFDDNGNLIWYHTYDYDEYGQESAIDAFDGSGILSGHIDVTQDTGMWGYSYDTGEMTQGIYEYDEKGRMSKVTLSEPGGPPTSYVVCEYGTGGDYRQSQYNIDGALTGYTDYDYENGNMVEYRSYDTEGELYYRGVRNYDSDGNLVKQSSFNGGGELIGSIAYAYDETGEMEREDHYDGNGNLTFSQSYK